MITQGRAVPFLSMHQLVMTLTQVKRRISHTRWASRSLNSANGSKKQWKMNICKAGTPQVSIQSQVLKTWRYQGSVLEAKNLQRLQQNRAKLQVAIEVRANQLIRNNPQIKWRWNRTHLLFRTRAWRSLPRQVPARLKCSSISFQATACWQRPIRANLVHEGTDMAFLVENRAKLNLIKLYPSSEVSF